MLPGRGPRDALGRLSAALLASLPALLPDAIAAQEELPGPLDAPRSLYLRARLLRVIDRERFEVEGVVVSACDFAVPHFGVHAGAGRVFPAPGSSVKEARPTPDRPAEAPGPPAVAPPPGPAEAPAPPRREVPQERILEFFNETRGEAVIDFDTQTNEVVAFYPAGVDGSFPWRRPDGKADRARIQADRLLVAIPAPSPRDGAPAQEGGPPRFALNQALLYGEGNVRVEARGMVLETDAFLYDRARNRAVAMGVRAHAELETTTRLLDASRRGEYSPLDPPLRGAPPEEGEEIFPAAPSPPAGGPSPPEEGSPPPAAQPLPGAPPPEGEDGAKARERRRRDSGAGEEKQHYIVEAENSTLDLVGVPFLPLPSLHWNTEWSGDGLPVHVQPGYSSKWGARVDADWNLNWLLRRTPLMRLEPARLFIDDSRLRFATDYRSRRGLGWGPEGLYGVHPRKWLPWELDGRSWNHYGESGYYAIRDEADEDSAGDVPIPDPDRHWAHVLHRQSLPHVGVLDVEYSERSDPNFLNEYFERVAKEEKEQESLVYFRRHFRDNMALTGLYKYRTDDFETVVERRPEGKFFLLEQPVARSGLYTGLNVQAADLRLRPAEGSGAGTVSSARFDAFNEWSYPLGIGRYVRFRPFASVRSSVFEEGADPAEGSLDREALEAGVTATQEYWRVFRLRPGGVLNRFLGASQVKHVAVPKVTYRNLYYNDVEPEELIPFDEVETVSTDERVELSFRNSLLVRRHSAPPRPLAGAAPRAPGQPLVLQPSETSTILDSEVSVDVFTHPARDNAGKQFSLLDLDLAFRPSRWFSMRTRVFLDPTEHLRLEAADASATVVPYLEGLRLTVGERYTRDQSSFTYGLLGVQLSPKYLLDLYVAYDFELARQSDIEVRLTRLVHEVAVEMVYGVDVGEGNNHHFSVNVQPAWLLAEARRRQYRASILGR